MSTASDLLKSAAFELGMDATRPYSDLREDLLSITSSGASYQILDGRALPGLDAVAWWMSRHKQVSKSLLLSAGLPCAPGAAFEVLEEWIEDGNFDFASNIIILFENGIRWVAKPARGSGGKGISLNIHNADDLSRHLDAHALESGDWIVEHFITGYDLGLLVLDGKIVSAVGRKAFALEGNGTSTLEELIDTYNASASPEAQFMIDSDARQLLRDQNAYLGEIVEANKSIRLSNRPIGGSGIESILQNLHPSYHELAAKVAAVFKAPFLAIDLVTTDESADAFQNATILEVDLTPEWIAYVLEHERMEIARRIVQFVTQRA